MKSFEKETVKAQLMDEQKALKDLEKAYKQAKKDVLDNLKALNARPDMVDVQTVIHQKRYQETLLKQIDGVLNDLQTHTYKSANEFFQGSYQNGYIGSMYELMKQGIPITVPVNTKLMMTAIQTDSKLSKQYYFKKGLSVQNIRTLKQKIASEVTRGIASGKSWLEVAELLTVQRAFSISQSDAIRIIRTEGNRINQQGRLDVGDVAIKNGCDLLKQWDATLDSRTREAHREADGQIVEWSEEFTVMGEKLKAPCIGGSASNVINCRCQLLKRPRWALDDEELETLKERAKFYGLDKSESFQSYKDKFLKLPSVPVQVQTIKAIQDVTTTTTKMKAVMTNDDYTTYCDLVGQNPDIAKCYKYADDLNGVVYKDGAGCFYASGKLEFGYPNQSYIDDGMSKYHTIAHEYGHFIDTFGRDDLKFDVSSLTWDEMEAIKDGVGTRYVSFITGHVLSNSDQFLSALRKDFEEIIAEGQTVIASYCKGKRNTTTGIQDAVDGWGLGRIIWGHGDKYYNRNYNRLKDWEKYSTAQPTKGLQAVYKALGFDASNQAKVKRIVRQYETASELWANMISAETTGGEELTTIKEMFPATYEVMKKILKGVK